MHPPPIVYILGKLLPLFSLGHSKGWQNFPYLLHAQEKTPVILLHCSFLYTVGILGSTWLNSVTIYGSPLWVRLSPDSFARHKKSFSEDLNLPFSESAISADFDANTFYLHQIIISQTWPITTSSDNSNKNY